MNRSPIGILATLVTFGIAAYLTAPRVGLAQNRSQLTTGAIQILLDLYKGARDAGLSPDLKKTLQGAQREEANWSGVYLSTTEGAYVFVVDDAQGVQWFMDTPCCTHAFSGIKKNGVASGRMLRREKGNACLTEYVVSDMKYSPGSTQILSSTLAPIPSCGVNQPPFTRQFERRW